MNTETIEYKLCRTQQDIDACGPEDNILIDFGSEADASVRHAKNVRVRSVRTLNAFSANISGSLYASGANISGSLNAYNANISGSLDASYAKISGDLYASGAKISGDLYASGANISGGLDASYAKISGSLYASGAKISSNFYASNAKIGGSLRTFGANISGSLNAYNANISGSLDASNANISGSLDASNADISGDLYASNAKIGGVTVTEPTAEQIELLDRLRSELLPLLKMNAWHNSSWSPDSPVGLCGTTHCLAGGAQAMSSDPEIRRMEPHEAGLKLLPCCAHLFFASQKTVEKYLRDREYA